MSDTQHDQAVQVADIEAERDRDRREARELAYQEVSLRAVELLASAQRAADEAVAEAQSYARDLEETAREQYRHILQRAHDAARASTGEAVTVDAASAEPGDAVASGDPGTADAVGTTPDAGSGLAGRELQYVRTYARVAHAQLSAVLGALTDELDRLAELADGSSPTAEDVAAGSEPDDQSGVGGGEPEDRDEESHGEAHQEPYGDGPDGYHDRNDAHG